MKNSYNNITEEKKHLIRLNHNSKKWRDTESNPINKYKQ